MFQNSLLVRALTRRLSRIGRLLADRPLVVGLADPHGLQESGAVLGEAVQRIALRPLLFGLWLPWPDALDAAFLTKLGQPRGHPCIGHRMPIAMSLSVIDVGGVQGLG